MSWNESIDRWCADQLRPVVEGNSGTLSIESGDASWVIDVDVGAMLGQLCVWPNGHAEWSVVRTDTTDDVAVHQKRWASLAELNVILESFRSKLTQAD